MCAQAKHSPSHTVDLYSPLFGRLRGAPPHLAPLRWVSIKPSLHWQPPPRSSSDLCSLFFFLSMFIFEVVSDLVRGHQRPHRLLELMFSCCAENPLDYNLILCSGILPTSTQICFDSLNLVPSSERNTFWWRNKTCVHSWWSPCWNNNRYHADRESMLCYVVFCFELQQKTSWILVETKDCCDVHNVDRWSCIYNKWEVEAYH